MLWKEHQPSLGPNAVPVPDFKRLNREAAKWWVCQCGVTADCIIVGAISGAVRWISVWQMHTCCAAD
jgi:hypothetical protein